MSGLEYRSQTSTQNYLVVNHSRDTVNQQEKGKIVQWLVWKQFAYLYEKKLKEDSYITP